MSFYREFLVLLWWVVTWEFVTETVHLYLEAYSKRMIFYIAMMLLCIFMLNV